MAIERQLEKITETKTYKNFLEMAEKSEEFKKGKKEYEEGKVKFSGIPFVWVKKWVKRTEWNSYYSHIGTYCPLVINNKEVLVGFLSAGKVAPKDCQEVTDWNELRSIDIYRRAYNIRPFVMKEDKKVEKEEEEDFMSRIDGVNVLFGLND
jgi:hypothetical protein